MKKLLAILMAGAMIVSLASCGGAGKVIFNGEETSLEKINEEFNSNEVVAKEKYEDKKFTIIDRIEEIEADVRLVDGSYDCQILTENGVDVAGDFDVSKLKVGDMIKIEGYLFDWFNYF